MINSNTISRRVRFSLPSHENELTSSPLSTINSRHRINNSSTPQQQQHRPGTNEKGRVHGTTTYVNGTLMSTETASQLSTHKNDQFQPKHASPIIELKSCFKDVPNGKKFHDNPFLDEVDNIHPAIDYDNINEQISNNHQPTTQKNTSKRQLKQPRPTTAIRSYPVIFSPSMYVKSLRNRNESKVSAKKSISNEQIPDLLTLPNILESHDHDCCHCTDSESEQQMVNDYRGKQLLLCNDDDDEDDCDVDDNIADIDDVFQNFENLKIVGDRSNCSVPNRTYQKLPVNGNSNVFGSNEENYSNFMVLVDQWREQKQKNRKYQLSNFLRKKSPLRTIPKLPPMKRNSLSTYLFNAGKSKSRKMSCQTVPLVSTLLRAAREADNNLLSSIFTDIVANGISSDDLNAVDHCGRTALSYVCSTDLTVYVDLLLRLPGIDANKADNDGNTPLHFAAQAGQSDIVNMLITRCRSLKVDFKNNMGITPLMKAALQGRTRCAKLLLFAGASAVEVDSARGMRANEWSRLCGRYTCAEMIEKCSRAKLLETNTSSKWARDVMSNEKNSNSKDKSEYNNSPTTNGANTGVKSKLGRVFPFRSLFKQKAAVSPKNREPEFVEMNGTLISSTMKTTKIKSNGFNRKQSSTVPKLEITFAANKKLSTMYDDDIISESPSYKKI